MEHFVLRPEVAGGWGPGTIADRSQHPPEVKKLTYEMQGWLGDHILSTFPCHIVTQELAAAITEASLTGDRSPTKPIINCWKYHATGAGQRTWVEQFDKRTARYTYDSLGRLKTEAVTGSIQDGKNGIVKYTHDNVGNRLSRISSLCGVTNQAFSYDANDPLRRHLRQ